MGAKGRVPPWSGPPPSPLLKEGEYRSLPALLDSRLRGNDVESTRVWRKGVGIPCVRCGGTPFNFPSERGRERGALREGDGWVRGLLVFGGGRLRLFGRLGGGRRCLIRR